MMKARIVAVVTLTCMFLLACSGKYKIYESNYTFKSTDGAPDYSNLDYWAAHPGKWDPADSIPPSLQKEERNEKADVFFIHPTTFTKKKEKDIANATIDDHFINAKTDYSTILYQASVFNASCRIYAPRYRQAHIHNFFTKDKTAAEVAFKKAYEDVKASFLYYLKNWNKERPIIIAGHSQGALMAERLLKEFFEGKELEKKLVAAYVIGWPVPKDYFSVLPMCKDSLQTGCVISWRTYRNGYVPRYINTDTGNALATNPLTWTTTGEYAPRKLNLGSVLTKFNKVYTHTTDARLTNGLLYVSKPRFPWSFLYFTRNYHIADINLFYLNMRNNIRQRSAAYLQFR
ncbi:MAG TPA: DUF3089 domain-containing protein [Chitinophagaceae bacterium]|nr:DUF3089 domain-containing protein [Chitinophagaceae bacterium]